MEHPVATRADSIIDTATLAAIHTAEDDYPCFLQTKALAQIADTKAHDTIDPLSPDKSKASMELYVGVFIAAYQLRCRSLLQQPTDSHHTSL